MTFNVTNREELRPIVVNTALEMFLKDGYLAVRMDDIASSLSISKRTLYEMFQNKEQLLTECMEAHSRFMTEKTAREIEEEGDILSVMLRYIEIVIAESHNTNRIFFDSLDKYPKFKEIFMSYMETFRSQIREYMDLGVKQGVFRDDVNMDVVMQAFTVMGRLANDDEMKKHYPYEQLVNDSIVLLLRGIAAPKGMEKLEKYRYKINSKE
ncbi:MAG: TetR/AcrR family transcriptional regulator [Bacteroidaceae bacterium]|nr:TetR/AcrR family transcriptional regulator [Candidatus Colenecus caballi]MCQ2072231.1 TetR/AcrR family transcriptional regulator [Bacteroidaceae bacterium]